MYTLANTINNNMNMNPLLSLKKLINKGVQGVESQQPVSMVKKAGADYKNPFEAAYVGIGIKDGATQTSAAQCGKKAMGMRQICIA